MYVHNQRLNQIHIRSALTYRCHIDYIDLGQHQEMIFCFGVCCITQIRRTTSSPDSIKRVNRSRSYSIFSIVSTGNTRKIISVQSESQFIVNISEWRREESGIRKHTQQIVNTYLQCLNSLRRLLNQVGRIDQFSPL